MYPSHEAACSFNYRLRGRSETAAPALCASRVPILDVTPAPEAESVPSEPGVKSEARSLRDRLPSRRGDRRPDDYYSLLAAFAGDARLQLG
jgi:hypothetical protein